MYVCIWVGGWKRKNTNVNYRHDWCILPEKVWQTRKWRDNIYHMLYYSKFCISHAYLPKDQHVNDYSWITYLKNQVLNLQHSVRKKKNKHLNEHSNHAEMSEDHNVFWLFVTDTVCEQWRAAGCFFRFCLKHGIFYVFFSPPSVWTNRTKNTGTLKMQLHQQFSVLYRLNIFLNKCIEYTCRIVFYKAALNWSKVTLNTFFHSFLIIKMKKSPFK